MLENKYDYLNESGFIILTLITETWEFQFYLLHYIDLEN